MGVPLWVAGAVRDCSVTIAQTPALIFAGIIRHDYIGVFIVMLAGKFFKYGTYAWLVARFPERFSNGVGGFFHLRR